jgi:F-type H+-transporting ATPase subunit b
MRWLLRRAQISVLAVLLIAIPAQLALTSATAQAESKSASKSHSESGDHKTGVPLDPKADLALWSLVSFVVFVFVLWKFAWGPLSTALDGRESKIAADIATAEQGRKDIERMIAEHRAQLEAVQDEVREVLAEARRDAEHAKQEIVAAAQKESEDIKNRSLTEIERAKNAALKELFDTVSGQVASAVEHILGRSLNDSDRDRLIDEALSQFSQN